MVDYYYQDLKDLRARINDQLLGYLNADDGRAKLRSKLVGNLYKYLCYVPHNNKFEFPQTNEVLRRSVTSRAAFSGERASRAWAALAKYAENLIRQPWRKEFREIKLYCGFYKHEVEVSLVGAEMMFEAMGYVHVSHSVMILQEDLFDVDKIIAVSKDAMLAETECIILQEVWEKVNKYDVTWSEILEGREQFVQDPQKLVQKLIYLAHSRRYGENPRVQSRVSYPVHYEGHHQMPHHHVVQPQMVYPPYNSMIPPSYTCGYSYPSQVLKPNDYYPTNCHLMHMRAPAHNGYSHFPYPATVPTGQLIELNTSPIHHPPHYYHPEPIRTTEIPSSRAKDDGAGSWENWDDVYQKLENRDSEKQLPERVRAMSLNRATTPPPLTVRSEGRMRTDGDGASRHRLSKNSIELEDAILPKARLTKKSSESEAEVNRTRPKRNPDYDTPTKPEPSPSNDDLQRSTEKFVEASKEKFNVGKPEPKLAVRHVVTLDVSPKFAEETSKTIELNTKGKWECCYCTFFNAAPSKICEMCNKTRNLDEIHPHPSGGPQCPTCTLVNERGKNFCSACNSSLKDSPTYI